MCVCNKKVKKVYGFSYFFLLLGKIETQNEITAYSESNRTDRMPRLVLHRDAGAGFVCPYRTGGRFVAKHRA